MASLVAFRIFFWFLAFDFWQFDYDVSKNGSPSSCYLRVVWASWKCRLMFFIKFGAFWAITSLKSLSVPFSPLLPGIPFEYCGMPESVPQVTSLCSFLATLFPFCSSDSIISTDPSSSLWILSLALICCGAPPVNFQFKYCTFQLQNFNLVFFKK